MPPVPEQPTLTDGVVTLRRWRLEDVVGADPGVDVVLAGDVWYELDASARFARWLGSLAERGIRVPTILADGTAEGWLVVEDLAMVVVLVLLPPLAGAAAGAAPDAALWRALGATVLQVVAFIALMLLVGRRAFPWLLWHVARTGSRELFTLCVVAAAVTIAWGSAKLFGVSFALGAFFAGGL